MLCKLFQVSKSDEEPVSTIMAETTQTNDELECDEEADNDIRTIEVP